MAVLPSLPSTPSNLVRNICHRASVVQEDVGKDSLNGTSWTEPQVCRAAAAARNPGFAVTVILTLALSIAANTAILRA